MNRRAASPAGAVAAPPTGTPTELLGSLEALAGNLWWSWNPAARQLFKSVCRETWKACAHNPVRMLRTVAPTRLEGAAASAGVRRLRERVEARFRAETTPGRGWWAERFGTDPARPVAFFSAEYGLHHALPFYAGGLGFLAGDFLKECSDLGIPAVGVGCMYPHGYVRQRIQADGRQLDLTEEFDPERAPIERARDAAGRPIEVAVTLGDHVVTVAVWRVQVGRVPLYLLDTDLPQNLPWERAISSQLYVGVPEHRLRQEVVLGLGGMRALAALGVTPGFLHLNEGHAAFALLAAVGQALARGADPDAALAAVRRAALITVHTPVPAGHEVFPYPLVESVLATELAALGPARARLLALGADPGRPHERFNMSVFALRCCGAANGVSERHGEVSRRMWSGLWPDRPDTETPIGHVTNGVHLRTWIEPKLELLLDAYLGPDWLEWHDEPATWHAVDEIPDEQLWHRHGWSKVKLIRYIQGRARARWLESPGDAGQVVGMGALLDPEAFTVGFARRFTGYKRPTLLLSDRERLRQLLVHPNRPVQIVFAGKSHPADEHGKYLVREVALAARDPIVGGRLAFVENYDERLAQYLVHGVDLWLNTPRPPLEACGTSGMKAALNGVPSCSTPDGWWLEAGDAGGWTIGDERPDLDPAARDAADAAALFDLLERDIVPCFYRRDDAGIPRDWVARMKRALQAAGPRFCARRMVKEYAARYYAAALRAADSPAASSR